MSNRCRLPNRRRHESGVFSHGGLAYTMGVGRFADGRPAEIFLSTHKCGSAVEAIARDAAILISIALQFGADIKTIRTALTRDQDGGPASLICAAVDALEVGQ
jgi:hypothetical protein